MSQSHAANAVGFLRRFDENGLEQLKVKYPGDAERAMLEEHLGPMSPLLKAQVEVTINALREFILIWSEKSPGVRQQMTRANTWSAVGSIIASVGSGSALALLLSGSALKTAAVSAAVGLLGGLIGVADRYLRRDIYGKEGSLVLAYQTLSSGASKASSLIRNLQPHLDASEVGEDPGALADKLDQANELIGSMQEVLQSLPR